MDEKISTQDKIVNSMPICVNPTGGMNCYRSEGRVKYPQRHGDGFAAVMKMKM